MKQRCLCPKDPFYHRYGGRGISICPKWVESFETFYAYMGRRPAGTTLDRRDSDGNYEPGNVQWSPHRVQQRNRCSNRVIRFKGETRILAEWASHLGLNVRTLTTRLNKLKWPVARALTEPLGPTGRKAKAS